jgi:hypothetical protein
MMPRRRIDMAKLWILRGDHEAPGWDTLRQDYKDEKVEIIHLDAKVWAILEAEEAPTGYEGLSAKEPADGMYIDPNGSPLYLVGGEVVKSAAEVVEALEINTEDIQGKPSDPETVLERLGRVY